MNTIQIRDIAQSSRKNHKQSIVPPQPRIFPRMKRFGMGNSCPNWTIFLWKITQEAIPVGENLSKRGLNLNTACIHCGELETTTHLFFLCDFAKKVRSLAPFRERLNSSKVPSFQAGLEKHDLSRTYMDSHGTSLPLALLGNMDIPEPHTVRKQSLLPCRNNDKSSRWR